MQLNPGTRPKSTVGTTEVIVVRASADDPMQLEDAKPLPSSD